MIYKVTTSTAPYSICVDGLGPQITTGQVRSIAMSMLDCEIVNAEFSHMQRGVPVFNVGYDHEGEGMGIAEFLFEPLQVEDISSFPGQQRVEEAAGVSEVGEGEGSVDGPFFSESSYLGEGKVDILEAGDTPVAFAVDSRFEKFIVDKLNEKYAEDEYFFV